MITCIGFIADESDEAAANRRRRQELPTEADIAVRDVGYLLDAQRVAAEVITNLCSPEEEGKRIEVEGGYYVFFLTILLLISFPLDLYLGLLNKAQHCPKNVTLHFHIFFCITSS